MSRSKALLPLFRLSQRNFTTSRPVRGGHGGHYNTYRHPGYNPPKDWWHDRISGQAIGGIFAFYTLYMSYNHIGIVIGEFPYHDPENEWSDEELGIPPDSEGLAPMIENPKSCVVPGHKGHMIYYGPYILEKLFGDTGDYKI